MKQWSLEITIRYRGVPRFHVRKVVKAKDMEEALELLGELREMDEATEAQKDQSKATHISMEIKQS